MRRKFFCAICAWVYDPALGDPGGNVKAGTAWSDVPDDWVCPLCGVGKERFFVMS